MCNRGLPGVQDAVAVEVMVDRRRPAVLRTYFEVEVVRRDTVVRQRVRVSNDDVVTRGFLIVWLQARRGVHGQGHIIVAEGPKWGPDDVQVVGVHALYSVPPEAGFQCVRDRHVRVARGIPDDEPLELPVGRGVCVRVEVPRRIEDVKENRRVDIAAARERRGAVLGRANVLALRLRWAGPVRVWVRGVRVVRVAVAVRVPVPKGYRRQLVRDIEEEEELP